MTAPTTPTTPETLSDTAIAELRRAHTGPVLVPADAGYDAARRAWNAMVDKRPVLIAQCAGVDDVAAAITFGRQHDLEIGVRCGAHSVVGHAIPDGGLMVDLSAMNAVRVDPDRRLASVQGGAVLGMLDRSSMAHGLATTAGNISHTGVGGLTLGGGMGWLARQLGMACDNVAAYQVVTADGSRLTASETENQDLFWGLRGGGGNFGVVTEFLFRLHPIADRALSVDIFYTEEDGPEVMRFFADHAVDAPRHMNYTAWAGTSGDWPFLPPELRGVDLVNVGFVWIGDPDEGRALVEPFRRVATPVAEAIEETTYVGLQAGSDEAMRPGLRRYWKDHYLRELSDEAIAAFLSRGGAAADGGLRANGGFQTYGGAIGEVGPDESAFSHRDAAFEFVTSSGWEDPAEDALRIAAPRRFAAAMEPFAIGAYVNGLADEGAAGVRHAYAPETLARLRAVKDRYDPDNVFHLNHNIVPSRASG
jgi:FAD/FMN-containing dehydrogenase